MTSTRVMSVVTRPAPDHEALLQALADRGLAAIHCPAFELQSEPDQQLAGVLGALPGFDLAIVTSPLAARLLAERLAPRDVESVQFVVPGAGTAGALDAAGIPARFPSAGGTSEDILGLPEFSGIEGKRVAIVGAPGGRGLLAREVCRRGAHVESVHVYRRVPLPPNPRLTAALRGADRLVIFISSLQAFNLLLQSLPEELKPDWLRNCFVVSSLRLARACREAGADRICSAAGASDASMLAAATDAGWIPQKAG